MKYTFTNGEKANEGDAVAFNIGWHSGRGRLVFGQSGPYVDTYPVFTIKQGRHGTTKSFQVLLRPDLSGCLARPGTDWSRDYPQKTNDFVNKSESERAQEAAK